MTQGESALNIIRQSLHSLRQKLAGLVSYWQALAPLGAVDLVQAALSVAFAVHSEGPLVCPEVSAPHLALLPVAPAPGEKHTFIIEASAAL